MARSSKRALLKSSGPGALPSHGQAHLPAIMSPWEVSCHKGAANLYNIMAHCLHMRQNSCTQDKEMWANCRQNLTTAIPLLVGRITAYYVKGVCQWNVTLLWDYFSTEYPHCCLACLGICFNSPTQPVRALTFSRAKDKKKVKSKRILAVKRVKKHPGLDASPGLTRKRGALWPYAKC